MNKHFRMLILATNFCLISILAIAQSNKALVPFTKIAPQIDGKPDNLWDSILSIGISNTIDVKTDFKASFKACWDTKNFYLFVNVEDNTFFNSNSSISQNDNLEINFDMDNSKKAGTFDADDFEIRLVANDKVYSTVKNILYGYSKTDKGYVMEAQIPWASLGIEANSGKVIGFDILLSDNDGNNRDAIAWNTTSFDINKDESLMGEVQLSANGCVQKGAGNGKSGKVYYVSPTGSDTNDGLTVNSPFKSVQKAANLTLPGDTVFLMSGTFDVTSPFMYVTHSGKADAWIIYKAFKGNKPKVKVSGRVWETILVTADYIIIEGLELEGDVQNIPLKDAEDAEKEAEAGGTDWDRYAIYNNGGITLGSSNSIGNHHSVIRNCVIHDFPGGGIQSIKMDYITVENNICYNNAWLTMYAKSGISLWHVWNSDMETGYKIFVRGNICHDNKTLVKWVSQKRLSDGNGIIIDDNRQTQEGKLGEAYVGRTLVENNICYNNGGSGIHAYSCNHVDIINNTAYNNGLVVGYPDIFQNAATDGKVMNNIMYSRNGGQANASSDTKNVSFDYNIYYNGSILVKGPHDKLADPMLLNATADPAKADFHLQQGSPAIDYGTSVFADPIKAPFVDNEGIIRPKGNGIDCGAYESSFTSSSNNCYLISPVNGESFNGGSTISMDAAVNFKEGTISKVEFYAGYELLGTDNEIPYSFSWKNVPKGHYLLSVRAFDMNGNSTISELVNVTVSKSNEIVEYKAGKFSLFPNPVNQEFTIQNNSNEMIKNIAIYSLEGKLMSEFGTINNLTIKINISNYKSGVYFLRITSSSKSINLKLIKE